MTKQQSISGDLADQIRDGIESAVAKGWSVNAIAHAAGVSQSSLAHWLSGRRADISLQTASKLCIFLRCHLTTPRPRRPE